jgi:hypothetical protein
MSADPEEYHRLLVLRLVLALIGIFLGLCVAVPQVDAQGYPSTTVSANYTTTVFGTPGYPANCTATLVISWNNFDQVNQVWDGTLTMTCSGTMTGNQVVGTFGGSFTPASGSTLSHLGYAHSYSGAIAWPPGQSFSEDVVVGGLPTGFQTTSPSMGGTTPDPPPQVRGIVADVTNTAPVTVTYYLTDKSTGLPIMNSAVQAAPGQTVQISGTSTGADFELDMVTSTLAQFQQTESTGIDAGGTASQSVSGVLSAGTQDFTGALQQLPYIGMNIATNSATGGDNLGNGGAGPIQLDNPAVIVSGSANGTPGAVIVNSGNDGAAQSTGTGSVIGGAGVPGQIQNGISPVAFQPGSNAGQTGDLGGSTNGQIAQLGNAIAQGLNGLGNILISGFAGAQQVVVDNFPANQAVNVTDFPSGGGGGGGGTVTFPSSMNVTGAVTVLNLPSSFASLTLPSGVGIVFPSSMVVTDANDAALDSLVSTADASLAQLNMSVSALDGIQVGAKSDLDSLVSQGQAGAGFYAAVSAALQGNPSGGAAASAGNAAATAVGDAATTYTAPSYPENGVPAVLTLTLPSIMGGAMIDFNPFESGRLAGASAAFRSACAWLVLALYGRYVWQGLREYAIGSANIKQATGNAVVGGTGAQATALIAATAISVAMLVLVTGLFALLGDIGFGNIASVMAGSSDPLSSFAGDSLWILNQLVPVSTIISGFLGRLLFDSLASKLFLVCSATVRFIVP